MATAFAVYSADDNSLNFYKRDTVPAAGDTFNGKTATTVYTGIETDVYDSSRNYQPWYSYRSSITSVSIIDEGIAPVSTAYWFYSLNNTSLTTIGGLDKLDTSNVTNMRSLFRHCEALTSLNLSGFNTSNVTNMSNMFSTCQALTSLDLYSFNTANVTDMKYMFSNCSALRSIYVSNKWNTNSVTSSNDMFHGCSELPNFSSSVVDKTNAHYNLGGYLSHKRYISPEDRVKVVLEKGAVDIIVNTIKEIESSIPAYTSADEGKFLRVVNGAPAWISIENAEGASF